MKDRMRKCFGLDAVEPSGQRMLKSHLLTKSWPGIDKSYRGLEVGLEGKEIMFLADWGCAFFSALARTSGKNVFCYLKLQ